MMSRLVSAHMIKRVAEKKRDRLNNRSRNGAGVYTYFVERNPTRVTRVWEVRLKVPE